MTCSKIVVQLFSVLALCLFVACSSCASLPYPTKSPGHAVSASLIHQVQSTIAIMKIDGSQVKTKGSGVVVRCEAGKPIRILTAAHVVKAVLEDDPSGVILVGSKERLIFKGVQLHRVAVEHDLALLEGIYPEKVSCPAAPVAMDLPLIGSYVWAVGNPMGMETNISHGVLGKAVFVEGTLMYRIDAAIAPGSSGGGLYDSEGRLIGITVSMQMMRLGIFSMAPVPGGGYAVSLPELWKFLNKQ